MIAAEGLESASVALSGRRGRGSRTLTLGRVTPLSTPDPVDLHQRHLLEIIDTENTDEIESKGNMSATSVNEPVHSPTLPVSEFDPSPVHHLTPALPIAALASSANISFATRNRVIASTGSLCWLCGVPGRRVAHVVPSSDQLFFNDLHASNLLTFPNLHSYRNLLYLCPNCHAGYNDRVPEWTFLPTDMDPFLAAEQAYHDLRRACFPIPIARPDPPNTGLYTRYQIRRGMVLRSTFRERSTEEWWGSSVAAITRSASALCGIKRLSVSEGGIPDDVAMKVQRLLWLYGTPDPEFMCIIRVPRADDNDHNGDNGDVDMQDAKEKAESSPPPPPPAGPSRRPARPPTRPPTRRSARIGKQPPSQRHDRSSHITPALTESQPSSRNGRCKSTKGLTEGEWFYGPKSTANDVSFWFRKAGGWME